MDSITATLDVIASESVVLNSDHGVRFFHESFFDYAFARSFAAAGEDPIAWLKSGTQSLFRRSQLRQIIAFMRERDREQYYRALRAIFSDPEIRFHLKKMVLQWLSTVDDPTGVEWGIVEDCTEVLTPHHWSLVGASTAWFDVVNGLGRPTAWLESDNPSVVDAAVSAISMPSITKRRPEEVAKIFEAFVGRGPDWDARLSWLMDRVALHEPCFADLFQTLTEVGSLDSRIAPQTHGLDWWSMLYSAAAIAPQSTAAAIGAWFDRRLALGEAADEADPFHSRDGNGLGQHSQWSFEVIQRSAEGAPREFADALFPRISSMATATNGEGWFLTTNPELSDPFDQIVDATARALARLAETSPAEFRNLVSTSVQHSPPPTAALLMRGWVGNAQAFAEEIIEFVLKDPTERLTLGYDIGGSGSDISRAAIWAATAHCSRESLDRLSEALIYFTPPWEVTNGRWRGSTELSLAYAVVPQRRTEKLIARIQELERKFPNRADAPPPPEPSPGITTVMVSSPLPEQAYEQMSDEQWLNAMRRYSND
ncbi:MAG: hypothetical protein DWG75_02365 [Chloroflexi bacterium]|nr:hypothetical protein [Chloroflexota bacterium]